MKEEYKILYVLVLTYCVSIVVGMVGVFAGKVDAQFVEGLVSGGLVGMISMLFKDILNKGDNDDKNNVPTIHLTTSSGGGSSTTGTDTPIKQ